MFRRAIEMYFEYWYIGNGHAHSLMCTIRCESFSVNGEFVANLKTCGCGSCITARAITKLITFNNGEVT